MTISEATSVAAAISASLATGFAIWTSLMARRLDKKVEQVHIATNSLVSRLLAEGKDASFRQGEQAERDKHP